MKDSIVDLILNNSAENYSAREIRNHFNDYLPDSEIQAATTLSLNIVFHHRYEVSGSISLKKLRDVGMWGLSDFRNLPQNISNHDGGRFNPFKEAKHIFQGAGNYNFKTIFFNVLATYFIRFIKERTNPDWIFPDASHKYPEYLERLRFANNDSKEIVHYCSVEIKKIIPLINPHLLNKMLLNSGFAGSFPDDNALTEFIEYSLRKLDGQSERIVSLQEVDATIESHCFYFNDNELFGSNFMTYRYSGKALESKSFTTNTFWVDLIMTFTKEMNEEQYKESITIQAKEGAKDLARFKEYLQLIVSKNDGRANDALNILNKIIEAESELQTKEAELELVKANEKKILAEKDLEARKIETLNEETEIKRQQEANMAQNYVDEKKQQLDAFNQVWEEIQKRVETIQVSGLPPQIKEFRIAQLMEQSEKAKQEIFGI